MNPADESGSGTSAVLVERASLPTAVSPSDESGSGTSVELVERATLPAHLKPEQLEPLLTRYRRDLPHWRLTGAIYFVTWRLHRSQRDLAPDEKDLVAAAMRHFDGSRHQLIAWVVMNDHAHALVKPAVGFPLENILHSWKSFSSHSLQRDHGRIGKLWQDESFDRIVRDEDEFWEKATYILKNPKRRWPEIHEYSWVDMNFRE